MQKLFIDNSILNKIIATLSCHFSFFSKIERTEIIPGNNNEIFINKKKNSESWYIVSKYVEKINNARETDTLRMR